MCCSVNRKCSQKPFSVAATLLIEAHHFVCGLLRSTSLDGCQPCTGEMKAISHLGSLTEKHKLLISLGPVNQ